jgi:hypothetical protein
MQLHVIENTSLFQACFNFLHIYVSLKIGMNELHWKNQKIELEATKEEWSTFTLLSFRAFVYL